MEAIEENIVHKYMNEQAAIKFNKIAKPIMRLARWYHKKSGKYPSLILIPNNKRARYSLKIPAGFENIESIAGMKIRFYIGIKTEVY